jgi:hypothetical protein
MSTNVESTRKRRNDNETSIQQQNKRTKIRNDLMNDLNSLKIKFVQHNRKIFNARNDLLNDFEEIFQKIQQSNSTKEIKSLISSFMSSIEFIITEVPSCDIQCIEETLQSIHTEIKETIEDMNLRSDAKSEKKNYIEKTFSQFNSVNTSNIETPELKEIFERIQYLYSKNKNDEVTDEELENLNEMIEEFRDTDMYNETDEEYAAYIIMYSRYDTNIEPLEETEEILKPILEKILLIIENPSKTQRTKYKEIYQIQIQDNELLLNDIDPIAEMEDPESTEKKYINKKYLLEMINILDSIALKINKSELLKLNTQIPLISRPYQDDENECGNNFTDETEKDVLERFRNHTSSQRDALIQSGKIEEITPEHLLYEQYQFILNLKEDEKLAVFYYTLGGPVYGHILNRFLAGKCSFYELHPFQLKCLRILIDLFQRSPPVKHSFTVYRAYPYSDLSNQMFASTSLQTTTPYEFIGRKKILTTDKRHYNPLNYEGKCCFHTINVLPGAKILYFPSHLEKITKYDQDEVLFPPDILNRNLLKKIGINEIIRFGKYHKISSKFDGEYHKSYYIYEPFDTSRYTYTYTDRTVVDAWDKEKYGPLILSFGSFVKKYKNKKNIYEKTLKYMKVINNLHRLS